MPKHTAHGWAITGPPNATLYTYSIADTKTTAIDRFLQVNVSAMAEAAQKPGYRVHVADRQNAWRRWKHAGYSCCKVFMTYSG